MLVTSINSASTEKSLEPLFTHGNPSKTQGVKNRDSRFTAREVINPEDTKKGEREKE